MSDETYWVWVRRKTWWPWKTWDFVYCGPKAGAEQAHERYSAANYGFGRHHDQVGIWRLRPGEHSWSLSDRQLNERGTIYFLRA